MFKQSHKEPQQVNNISTLNFTREKGEQKHTSHFPIFLVFFCNKHTHFIYFIETSTYVQKPPPLL